MSILEAALALTLFAEVTQMSQDHTVDFSTERAGSVARLKWSGNGVLEVGVELLDEDTGAEPILTLEGVVLDDVLEGLADLESPEDDGEHVLRVTSDGDEIVALAWSVSSETPELLALREAFERVGHLPFAEASAYARRGAEQRGAESHQAAAETLLAGIESLGRLYWDGVSRDDTSTKKLLGKSHLRKGDFEAASYVLLGVLENRLEMYRRVHLEGSDG